ncbi:exopolysaccharide biosynthesis polyprenyl glycosylphosphotransferase [Sphingobium sp. JS3065]|jgi:exopolysaccharide biosynthesis polyprenyl glycosylphosphotransferase|uniref:exopolysaccharide biosynthesis polyprenyl glycosylphosphotransferase n=1 Tax=Sphingobium sp. JS3065 TaxID=2970925 RepID=UPI0022642C27|nr:exopolysaccharide biosynthesis polyprenyl glycosylphosphotransferase [Sphingobium sp. JS3065]UZW56570.1 exopolysaccharide biosynthesis polyprenyl glycosylphosphotransferase [Sphingobium sp. JS3065]
MNLRSAVTRRKLSSRQIRVTVYAAQMMTDVFILLFSFLTSSLARVGHLSSGRNIDWITVLVPAFIVVAFYGRLYTLDAMQSYRLSARRACGALAWAVAITLLAFFSKDTDPDSRFIFSSGCLLSLALLMLVRIPIALFVNRAIPEMFLKKLLILDNVSARAVSGYDVVDTHELGLKLDIHDPVALHTFSSIVRDYDRILVDCRVEDREHWSLYLQAIGCIGYLLIPELRPVISDHARLAFDAASIRVSTGPMDLRSRAIKRSFDILIAVAILILVTPLLILVAIAIKCDSPGPVLFKQIRMGRGNRLFHVFKFRSMRHELADASGATSASRDDHRITRVGRFIRASSIDELPQIFNVLRGDMSLVGPRPHALGSRAGDDLFWHIDVRYWLRHSAKPGITGLAQIRGYRGATDTRHDLIERLRYDLEYVRNWSIVNDLRILLATFGVVMHKNAY